MYYYYPQESKFILFSNGCDYVLWKTRERKYQNAWKYVNGRNIVWLYVFESQHFMRAGNSHNKLNIYEFQEHIIPNNGKYILIRTYAIKIMNLYFPFSFPVCSLIPQNINAPAISRRKKAAI